MGVRVSLSHARKFLLRKQLLLPSQSLGKREGIAKIFNTLCLIQYDPLNPCGRNVDLVLQARIRDYHPEDYFHWLYTKKKGIECYDKELCIIPIEDFVLTNIRRNLAGNSSDKQIFLRTHEKEITFLLKRIAASGPISSSDIIDQTRVQSGWGTDARFGRIALETLWKMGRLMVVKREHGKKYYDLPSVGLLADINSSGQSLTREHVKRRLRSVGLLPQSGTGGGWQGLGSVRMVINQLVNEGEFLEVHIAGIERSYVIAKEDKEELMEDPRNGRRNKVVFIAPLDNLMWDRQMILELFGFQYRWEVYTPLVKRKYGYYVLPILYGDQFIGRIEPVLTKEGTLVIKGFWQEDKKVWDKKIWQAFAEGLERFKIYVKAIEIINSPLTHIDR